MSVEANPVLRKPGFADLLIVTSGVNRVIDAPGNAVDRSPGRTVEIGKWLIEQFLDEGIS